MPTGTRLGDGFATYYTFGLASPDVGFWEVEVTPVEVDGGDAVETSTMRNTTYKTRWPQSLKSLGSSTLKAAYDPAVYVSLISQVNVNQLITIRFPDHSTLKFYGFIQRFAPDPIRMGEMPTATVTITATNLSPTKIESNPTFSTTAPA